jgi:hypothetical protein
MRGALLHPHTSPPSAREKELIERLFDRLMATQLTSWLIRLSEHLAITDGNTRKSVALSRAEITGPRAVEPC